MYDIWVDSAKGNHGVGSNSAQLLLPVLHATRIHSLKKGSTNARACCSVNEFLNECLYT